MNLLSFRRHFFNGYEKNYTNHHINNMYHAHRKRKHNT